MKLIKPSPAISYLSMVPGTVIWSEDPATNLKHIIFYKKILIKGDTHYIFALTSLQSINEAISFMNNYNIYMLFLAIFLILLLSFLYSKMIATPLIRMNKAAKQMAELDFDVYCDIKTGDEIEKMNILILDMLEVSALESKAYTLSEENFDINSLITKLNTRFDPLLKKHNLALELSLESNTAIGDKLKIEQVLMNLISNAIRYSNSNETIRIKTYLNFIITTTVCKTLLME